MSDRIKEYEKKFVPIIEDKVRVISLELIKEADINGFWVYEIIFVENDQVKKDNVMGKDMSDALYRYSQILEMPQSRFSSKFFKK